MHRTDFYYFFGFYVEKYIVFYVDRVRCKRLKFLNIINTFISSVIFSVFNANFWWYFLCPTPVSILLSSIFRRHHNFKCLFFVKFQDQKMHENGCFSHPFILYKMYKRNVVSAFICSACVRKYLFCTSISM